MNTRLDAIIGNDVAPFEQFALRRDANEPPAYQSSKRAQLDDGEMPQKHMRSSQLPEMTAVQTVTNYCSSNYENGGMKDVAVGPCRGSPQALNRSAYKLRGRQGSRTAKRNSSTCRSRVSSCGKIAATRKAAPETSRVTATALLASRKGIQPQPRRRRAAKLGQIERRPAFTPKTRVGDDIGHSNKNDIVSQIERRAEPCHRQMRGKHKRHAEAAHCHAAAADKYDQIEEWAFGRWMRPHIV